VNTVLSEIVVLGTSNVLNDLYILKKTRGVGAGGTFGTLICEAIFLLGFRYFGADLVLHGLVLVTVAKMWLPEFPLTPPRSKA